MKKILVLLIVVFCFSGVYSQVQLSLLDGSKISLESYFFHNNEQYVDYSYITNNGKLKKKYANLEDVFSITIDGIDSIIYMPFSEEEFSVPDMQQIILAKQYCVQEYNPWWAYLTGLAVGCGSLFIPMDPFTRLLIPIAYTASMAFVKPSKSYIINRHDYAAGNELFYYGYRHTGRKKIFKNTVIGTVGGIFLAGAIVGTLQLIDND